jgi:hypothetical protein
MLEPSFERYMESARRAIYFARFEANQGCIYPEHLLLGILRESPFRSQTRVSSGKHRPNMAPYSSKTLKALAYAERRAGKHVTLENLLAGVLSIL